MLLQGVLLQGESTKERLWLQSVAGEKRFCPTPDEGRWLAAKTKWLRVGSGGQANAEPAAGLSSPPTHGCGGITNGQPMRPLRVKIVTWGREANIEKKLAAWNDGAATCIKVTTFWECSLLGFLIGRV